MPARIRELPLPGKQASEPGMSQCQLIFRAGLAAKLHAPLETFCGARVSLDAVSTCRQRLSD